VRQDLLNAIRRLIRDELMLLRRLGNDRRLASSRMPTLMRTGPRASSNREIAR
jgi:hypothetical protein